MQLFTVPPHPARTSSRRLLAVFAAVSLVLGMMLALPPMARAATPGISTSVVFNNGTKYNGTQVVDEGEELTLRVAYTDEVVPGSEVEFELGTNVELTGWPSSDAAVESFTATGNKLVVKFKDPWPEGVTSGGFDLKFEVKDVDESVKGAITWKVDGDERSAEVIVRNSGDEFADVQEEFSKSVNIDNFNQFVSVEDGVVKVDEAIKDIDPIYTLIIKSPEARSSFEIVDQLPAGMQHLLGGYNAKLTTWDADGLNKKTESFNFSRSTTDLGRRATATLNIPGPSILEIFYTARVDTFNTGNYGPGLFAAQLQEQYDALGGEPGLIQISVENTATFGGVERTAAFVMAAGWVPSVGVEKWSDEGGSGPEYDASGKLLNDGYLGDFDVDPGKELVAGEPQAINVIVVNDGNEPLKDIEVEDVIAGGSDGVIKDFSCLFPGDIEGSWWDGPLLPGESFTCSATLEGMDFGEYHKDTVYVEATGVSSGVKVQGNDSWQGYTPPYVEPSPDHTPGSGPSVSTGGAAADGANLGWAVLGMGLVTALVTAGAALNSRRRERAFHR